MSVLAECRETRGLAGNRPSRMRLGHGGACLMCLLALAGFCRIQSAAVADTPLLFDGAKASAADNSDEQAVPARAASEAAAEKPGASQPLATEANNSEEYKKLVAESPYPPAAAPWKLTLEQLEAIAKLAPGTSTTGMRVHPAVIPLFRSMILHYDGGSYQNAPIRFRLHVPGPLQQGKKYPLVVWLHGAGECGTDNVNQLAHLHHILPYLVGPKKRDFFLLVPQCPHTHVAWEAPEICSTTIRPDGSIECKVVDDPIERGNAPLAFTIAMIEAVLKEFPVDPNRVTVAGLSTGGDGVWRMLERRPDLFAAAAPIVSWRAMQENSLRDKPLLKKIPIWAIYSSDDHGIDFARKEFQRMRDAGCNVHKTEFGVCGHRAWTPAMLQGDVFGWLISRAKDGNRFFAAERSPTDPEKVGIFADVTEGDLARTPTKAVRTDGAAGGSGPYQVSLQPTAVAVSTYGAPRSAASYQKYPPTAGAYSVFPSPAVSYPVSPPTVGAYSAVPPATPTEAARTYPPTAAYPYPPGPYAATPLLAPASSHENPPYPYAPRATAVGPRPAFSSVDGLRVELVERYLAIGEPKKAIAVADKVKNRARLLRALVEFGGTQQEVLDYVDRELDRMEQRHGTQPYSPSGVITIPKENEPPRVREGSLQPIPVGKKSPMDECGKEWAMSPTTFYGLFPNGWEQEARHVPGYVVNETGRQLRDRLFKAFAENNLAAMKEFCDSFIRLDDIPLSSPWFDTSGGRLQSRIKYSLNEKAKPVVELLREIAAVQAESKKEFVALARKSLDRIDAITHPKTKE